MSKILLLCVSLSLFAFSAQADEPTKEGDKLLRGMSVVGNDEAPKSLVIVPWKSSVLGQTIDLSRSTGHDRRPVDKDVFLRELSYYAIRVGSQSR